MEASPFFAGRERKIADVADDDWILTAATWKTKAGWIGHTTGARERENLSDNRYYGNEYPIAVYPSEMKKGPACRALRFSPVSEKIIL